MPTSKGGIIGPSMWRVGDQTIKATPGTMVSLPRDVAHSFVIDSEQLRMLITNQQYCDRFWSEPGGSMYCQRTTDESSEPA